MKQRVCIFCGANTGTSQEIVNQAKELCKLLIDRDFDLVYGGGKTGLMGIIANEFLNRGKEVIGVRPKKLIKDEDAYEGLTNLIVVDSMQERKSKMVDLSDVFIALPGGIGTLDEIIETFTLFKIGFIDKPSGVLNTANYYKGLEILLEEMTEKQFLTHQARAGLVIDPTPKDLLGKMGILKSSNTNKRVIDKVAFIDIRNGKILGAKSHGKDKYYIPGGKRENGESDEQTLSREIFEELSVHVIQDSIQYVGTFQAQADGKKEGVDVVMACYKADYKEELQASSEIQEIKWLNYKDIDQVAAVDKIIFNYLQSKGELV